MRAQHMPLVLLATLVAVARNHEEVKLDTSSEEAYRRSLASVRASVPETLRGEFDKAIMAVVIASLVQDDKNPLSTLTAMALVAQSPSALLSAVAPVIHGKNGLQVIAAAEDLQRTQRARQISAIDGEMAALSQELEGAEAAVSRDQVVLDSIRIEGARYYWVKGYFRNQAVIAFKITNGSDRALAKITMEGLLETPGKAVPWVKDSFSYVINGGLEPKESQVLALAPGMFGPWSDKALEHRRDLVITVRLVAIEDGNGNTLRGAPRHESKDKRRHIGELKAQRAKLTGTD